MPYIHQYRYGAPCIVMPCPSLLRYTSASCLDACWCQGHNPGQSILIDIMFQHGSAWFSMSCVDAHFDNAAQWICRVWFSMLPQAHSNVSVGPGDFFTDHLTIYLTVRCESQVAKWSRMNSLRYWTSSHFSNLNFTWHVWYFTTICNLYCSESNNLIPSVVVTTLLCSWCMLIIIIISPWLWSDKLRISRCAHKCGRIHPLLTFISFYTWLQCSFSAPWDALFMNTDECLEGNSKNR